MPKINDEVSQIIAENKSKFEKSESYNSLNTFYKEAQKAGLIVKPRYSIPQTDTIGKKYHESVKNKVID